MHISNFDCYCQTSGQKCANKHPTKCESFRFPASLAKLEMIGHFGLCHLIGDK